MVGDREGPGRGRGGVAPPLRPPCSIFRQGRHRQTPQPKDLMGGGFPSQAIFAPLLARYDLRPSARDHDVLLSPYWVNARDVPLRGARADSASERGLLSTTSFAPGEFHRAGGECPLAVCQPCVPDAGGSVAGHWARGPQSGPARRRTDDLDGGPGSINAQSPDQGHPVGERQNRPLVRGRPLLGRGPVGAAIRERASVAKVLNPGFYSSPPSLSRN